MFLAVAAWKELKVEDADLSFRGFSSLNQLENDSIVLRNS
jgi:hypothetical protein